MFFGEKKQMWCCDLFCEITFDVTKEVCSLPKSPAWQNHGYRMWPFKEMLHEMKNITSAFRREI